MKRLLVIILLVCSLVGGVVVLHMWNTLFKPNTNPGTSFIYIKTGNELSDLLTSLDTCGRIINQASFKRASDYEDLKNIKPGRYKITSGMSNRDLIRMFRLGLQTPHNLTLSGNINGIERLASIISGRIESDSATVMEVLTNQSLIDSLGFNKYTFPGMFLNNTYEIYWTTKPKDLIIRLKREYEKFWNNDRRSKAAQLGLTPQEVGTLASIVAMESNLSREHAIIAGVYINRIKIGMPLQADPTIKFALNDPSVKRILIRHLSIDSPYNTYKYRGLPPGPIVIPSPSIIDSVLNYSKHKYLYFCANPSFDGSHSFASTLTEHNRNARAYHNALK
ncbi:MAG: endolytic transglycosylase MltG [Bacteroidales bacterium]|nr:endolytic transglycosylase MltG [Bacteroidales bacterium]